MTRSWSSPQQALVVLCLTVLYLSVLGSVAGCTSAPAPATAAPVVTREVPRDAATAAAIERALTGDHRTIESRGRDQHQHPVDTLLFFGLKPAMTVVVTWPGTGAWYSEVLAPLLSTGKLFVVAPAPEPTNTYLATSLAAFRERLATRPEIYGTVSLATMDAGRAGGIPPGSANLVLSVQNLHAWMAAGTTADWLAALNAALAPGGILGMVESRADPARPVDERATNGYVNEEHAIRLIEAAGFELLARSEINANPRDTRDYGQGVWVLPPNYRAGNRDRAKYETIGESDRFTLKFRKRG